jgi:hypothetical protein
MIEKTELYAIIACLVLSIGFAFGGYFKGCHDTELRYENKQEKANDQARADYEDREKARALLDDEARTKTAEYMQSVDSWFTNIKARYANLPTVTLDRSGCPALTDTARLRWNAVELLPTEPTDVGSGKPADAVQAPAVPPAR